MWKLDSLDFRRVRTSWNRAVRSILHLPYLYSRYIDETTTHEFTVMQARCARFLNNMEQCLDYMVRTC